MKKTALVLLAAVGTAHADPTQSAAIVQFDKGRALMKDKKYAEACDAFAKSQQLDPQAGTLYNLATCQMQIGKLASAWATFRDLAQVDPNPKRKKDDAKNAAALEPRLPRLTITVPSPAPAGLRVMLDGADVTAAVGTPSPIDLGDHEIRATATGAKPISKVAKIAEEGKTVTVDLAVEPAAAEPVADGPMRDGPSSDRHAKPEDAGEPVDTRLPVVHNRHKRLVGGIIAVGGVAIAGVGLFFGSQAKSEWNSAKDLCPDNDHRCATSADYATAKDHVDSAHSKALLSTTFVIAGGAAFVVGGVIFLTGKKYETLERVSASATRDSASLVYLGRF